MIRVENLTKNFGDRLIFDGIGFSLHSKERVGLVGQNGHGKTTLFRLITGEEPPDAGSVIIPKNYRIVYVQQHLEFAADTALDEEEAPADDIEMSEAAPILGNTPEEENPNFDEQISQETHQLVKTCSMVNT